MKNIDEVQSQKVIAESTTCGYKQVRLTLVKSLLS